MHFRTFFYLGFLWTFLTYPLSLYGQFTIKGEIRPRTEWRHGYRSPFAQEDASAIFTSQRSRLYFKFAGDGYQVFLSLQDVRVWGDEEHLKDVPSAAVHEAWAQISFTEWLAARMGRQELVYDDHRLLGNVNWTQQARSHDALVFKLSRKQWKGDIGIAWNANKEALRQDPYPLNNYQSLFYLWIQHTLLQKGTLSYLFINDNFKDAGRQNSGVKTRYTGGIQFSFPLSLIQFKGTAYYQWGKMADGRAIRAYFAGIALSSQFSHASLTLASDVLSGDSPDNQQNVYRAFHTLYATNHKFYGYMDYFLNIPKDTYGGGLMDTYIRIKWAPARTAVSLTAHYFRQMKTSLPVMPDPPASPNLGMEIDATFQYKLNDAVTISGGISRFFPTETLILFRGGSKEVAQYWNWLMVSVNTGWFTLGS